MPDDFNPFTEKTNLQYFVGREHLLRQFITDLAGLKAKNPNHQYIAGLHGTGKTFYLAKLGEIARQSGFLAALPVLDEGLAYKHVTTILESLLLTLQPHLKSRQIDLLQDWKKGSQSQYFNHPRGEDLSSDRLRQDFQTIETFVTDAGFPGTLICIDEGQRINGRAMSALKNSLQTLGGYLVVLSLRLLTDLPNGVVATGRAFLDTKASTEAENDIGASRFYVKGVPIGPFDTDYEAAECIRRRLANNLIQFNSDVVDKIGTISGRIPKNIIALANSVYTDAQEGGANPASLELLNHTFRSSYRSKAVDAQAVLSDATEAARMAVRSLIELRQSANARAVAAHLYPSASPEQLSLLSNGVETELDRLCTTVPPLCTKIEDRFAVPDPEYSYAIELALG